MEQEIKVEEFLDMLKSRKIVPIDVRSPSEFEDGTIPGSLNFPIFDDDERAEIGILYKQTGRQAAMDRGLELVSAKLPAYVREVGGVEGQKAVFCWRGGMRSKAAAAFLSLMGIKVYRLIGGIREYRRWVVASLENFQLKSEIVVLNGNTGTGKTAILRALAERGHPVLDLEGLAGHRGSIFGEIGLKARNQKQFDSLLLHKLLSLQEHPYLLMEAESRRIGKVVLPEFLMKGKESGLQFYLELPMAERIRRVLEDYRLWEHHDEALNAFTRIKSRIHTPVAKMIEESLQQERYDRFVGLLLEHYYDPRYQHSLDQYEKEPMVIKAETMEEALDKFENALKAIYSDNTALTGIN